MAHALASFSGPPAKAADLPVTTASLEEILRDNTRFRGKTVIQSDVVDLRATYVQGDGFEPGLVVYRSFDYRGQEFTLSAHPALVSNLQHPSLLEPIRARVFALTLAELHHTYEIALSRLGPRVAQSTLNSAKKDIYRKGFPEKHIKSVQDSISFPAYLTMEVWLTGTVQIRRIDVLLDADHKRLEKRQFKNTFQVLSVDAKTANVARAKRDAWSRRLGVDGLQKLATRARQAALERAAEVEAMLNGQFAALTTEALHMARRHEAEFWNRIDVARRGGNPFGSVGP